MVNEPFLLFRAGIGLGDPHFDQLAESVGMQPDRCDAQYGAKAAIILNEVEALVADLHHRQINYELASKCMRYRSSGHEPMHLQVDDVGSKYGLAKRQVLSPVEVYIHAVRECIGQILKNLPLKCSVKFHSALSRGRSVAWKRKATVFEGATQIECGVSA